MCHKCSYAAPATGSQPAPRGWVYVPAIGAYPDCLSPWPGLKAMINGAHAWLSGRRESDSREYGPTGCAEAVCSKGPELKGLVAPLLPSPPPTPPATLTTATCRPPPPFLAALPPPPPPDASRAVLRWLEAIDPSARPPSPPQPPPPPDEDHHVRHWLARISPRPPPPVYDRARRRCRVVVPHYRGVFRRRARLPWRKEEKRRRRVMFPWALRRLLTSHVIGLEEEFLGVVFREGSVCGSYHRRRPHLLVFSRFFPWCCG
jgi:hypothetical protein